MRPSRPGKRERLAALKVFVLYPDNLDHARESALAKSCACSSSAVAGLQVPAVRLCGFPFKGDFKRNETLGNEVPVLIFYGGRNFRTQKSRENQ